jgi:hypothetical protein
MTTYDTTRPRRHLINTLRALVLIAFVWLWHSKWKERSPRLAVQAEVVCSSRAIPK